MASLLIGLMLLPSFSLPVEATIIPVSSADENAKNFEPVNPPQWIWESSAIKLNAKVDEWLTPMRKGNDLADNDIPTEKPDAHKTKTAEILSEKVEMQGAKKEVAEEVVTSLKNSASATSSKNLSGAKLLMPDIEPERPPIAENELPQLVSSKSNLGNPIGQTDATSTTPASAMRTTERYGIGNFGFSLPIASLPGRGMDAAVGLSYNSQLWTKISSSGADSYIYNVDGNWLAPGFQMSYGYLDGYGGYGEIPNQFILTGTDGTRHLLTRAADPAVGKALYQSSDGSFIDAGFTFSGSDITSAVKISYTDGTKIEYGTSNSQKRRFPVKINDRQGNFITIAYPQDDNSGKMSSIQDTLGREIIFHYDNSSQKLVAVTVPGYNGSATRRQTIRFYYENLTLQTTGRFDGAINAPTTPLSVLKYVYFPGTKTGYRYDYSPYYGMIYKVTRLNGMQVTGGSVLDQMGAVTAGSPLESAWTRYNYPGTDIAPPAPTLNDVPKYTTRTDDWQGRTGTAPQTVYTAPVDNVDASGVGTRTTQVTSSLDGTINISVAKVNPGQWDDGLTKEVSLTTAGRTLPWTKTTFEWEPGQGSIGRRNQRVHKIETANEAGQSQATIFGYDDYNNRTLIKELDFAASGQEGTELRRTEITYETNSQWTGFNRLVRLPLSIKKKVGAVYVSRTDYKYDQNELANAPGVVHHNDEYNKYITSTYPCNCRWVCHERDDRGKCIDREWVCASTCTSGYNTQTDFRGNVTEVKSFVDPNATGDDPNASQTTFKYDITGNTVEAGGLSCCGIKKWKYDDVNQHNQYTYPISEIKVGEVELETKAEYDFNTGLVMKTIDENNQPTNYEYESDTLRQKKVTYPNGGYALTQYSDKVFESQPTLQVPGFVHTTTLLEAGKTTQTYNYFDARGLPIRTATLAGVNGWVVSAAEYDNLGRPKRSYNPFDAPSATSAVPSNQKFTEVVNYDGLGRRTEIKLQDNTTVATNYNGTTVTATDQAGKQRRQVADALGRTVRVDEPNPAGNLDVNGVPAQPTFYEYDGNDNLSKVIQSDGTTTQERVFKYDALSRLTHERQVEARRTLGNDGQHGAVDPNKWTTVLKYDIFNRLTDGWDARGVHTEVTYDDLNRVEMVKFSDGTPTVEYTYDQHRNGFFNKGAMTRVETKPTTTTPTDTPTTATEFDYDNMGRVAKHRQSIGTQVYNQEYGYNLAGQLTSQKYPSGKVVTYDYDTNGRLANIADQSRTFLSNIAYAHGNLNSMTLGNTTIQNFAYNERLQISQQNLIRGTEVLQDYYYNYGQMNPNTEEITPNSNNGQLAQVKSFIGGQQQWTQKFFYDSLGRLSKAKEYKGATATLSYQQKFDFDRFGNMYRKATENSPTQSLPQESPLQFTPIEETDISKSTNQFTANTIYDDAGNMTQDTKFGTMKFAYDANGRMIKTSTTNDTNQTNSVYDASGQRVATRNYDVWKFFIYDAFGKLVSEYGGLSSTDEGGIRYVLTDWQGSTRAIVSNSGFVQARQDFTAFGEQIAGNVGLRASQASFDASSNLNQKYALTERDQASGLDHTWWRKLENRAGRWTSPDPYNGSISLGSPQSFNRYSYVENQPTNFVDPSGLWCTAITTTAYNEDGTVNSRWTDFSGDCFAFPTTGAGGGGGGGIRSGGGGGGYVAGVTGGVGLPPIPEPPPTKPGVQVEPNKPVSPIDPKNPKLPPDPTLMQKVKFTVAILLRILDKFIRTIIITVDPDVICAEARKEGSPLGSSPLCSGGVML